MTIRDNTDEPIRFFSIAEVESFGVSTRTVRRWIDKKFLIAHRINRLVRIADRDLRAFLAANREE